MEVIRILHVVSTMDFGGVETLLMSIYRKIDRNKIQFDFLCHNRLECKFKEEIELLGGRLYMIPGPSHVGFLKYGKICINFFKNHSEYKIIHAHLNNRNGEVLWYAAIAGIPIRISHCHISGVHHGLMYSIYRFITRRLNNCYATHFFACSKDAGLYLFGTNKFIIIPNSINTKSFLFSENDRIEQRGKYKVNEDEILIGHVGRFSLQKNHDFILKVFKQCIIDGIKCKLILIGGGELEIKIREKAKQLKIDNYIIWGGQHSELNKFYSAMDIFLFPSLFEGLGIVAIEAQCSGLPVLASTNVPIETKITDNIDYLSLSSPLSVWVNKIKELVGKKYNRLIFENIVNKSNYNIDYIVKMLQDIYVENYIK